MELRNITPANIRDAHRAYGWQNVLSEQRPVGIKRAWLPFCCNVFAHKLIGHIAEQRDGSRSLPLRDRIAPLGNSAKELLGLGAGLIGREPPMLTDSGAPGASGLPVLRDINLLAAWERGNAKPGNCDPIRTRGPCLPGKRERQLSVL
jgi:hypothetical protein